MQKSESEPHDVPINSTFHAKTLRAIADLSAKAGRKNGGWGLAKLDKSKKDLAKRLRCNTDFHTLLDMAEDLDAAKAELQNLTDDWQEITQSLGILDKTLAGAGNNDARKQCQEIQSKAVALKLPSKAAAIADLAVIASLRFAVASLLQETTIKAFQPRKRPGRKPQLVSGKSVWDWAEEVYRRQPSLKVEQIFQRVQQLTGTKLNWPSFKRSFNKQVRSRLNKHA